MQRCKRAKFKRGLHKNRNMMSADATGVLPVICMHTRAIATHISVLLNTMAPPTPFRSPRMAEYYSISRLHI